MKRWKKALSAFIVATVMSVGVGVIAGCGEKTPAPAPENDHSTHNNWSDWVPDPDNEDQHMRVCQVEGCDADPQYEAHKDENPVDGKCDVCEAEMGTEVSAVDLALDYIEEHYPVANYTKNATAYNAQLDLIKAEPDDAKLALPGEGSEAGETLKAVLEEIAKIKTDEDEFLAAYDADMKAILDEYPAADYEEYNKTAYWGIFLGAGVVNSEHELVAPDYSSKGGYTAAMAWLEELKASLKTQLSALQTDEELANDPEAAALVAAKNAALAYIQEKFPVENYSQNLEDYNKEIAKINAATDKGDLAIPEDAEEFSDAGDTLKEVLLALAELDDDEALFEAYMAEVQAEILAQFDGKDYRINASAYTAVFEEASPDGEPKLSNYDSYNEAIAALDEMAADIKAKLAELKTDREEIEAEIEKQLAELATYKAEEIAALVSDELKADIADILEDAEANVKAAIDVDAILESADFWEEGETYYVDVIKAEIAKIEAQIDEKIAADEGDTPVIPPVDGWATDASKHWHEATPGEKTDEGYHIDANADGKCDECEYDMSTVGADEKVQFNDVHEFDWSKITGVADNGVLSTDNLKGVNSFIIPNGSNLQYRTSNTDGTKSGVAHGGVIQAIKGGAAFSVTFKGTGTFAIGVRGTGNSTNTSFYLEDASGNKIAATYDGSAAMTASEADGVYTMQSENYHVFTFTIEASGTYTFFVPSSADNNCRIGALNVTDNYEEDAVGIISVTLDRSEADLVVGYDLDLVATINPSSNNYVKSVVWSIEGNGDTFVSVDQNGKVSGIAAGEATVVVTVTDKMDRLFVAKCVVEVTLQNVTGVTLDREEDYVAVGQDITLVATVNPTDASNKNVTWAVTEGEQYAEVDQNGKVTGKAEGTAVITVTTEDGSFTATCSVQVIALPDYTGSVSTDDVKTVDVSAAANKTYTSGTDAAADAAALALLHNDYPESTFITGISQGNASAIKISSNTFVFKSDAVTVGGSGGSKLVITTTTDNAELYIRYNSTTGKRFLTITKDGTYIGEGLVQSGSKTTISATLGRDSSNSDFNGIYEGAASTSKDFTVTLPTAGEYVILFYSEGGTNKDKDHKIDKIVLTETKEEITEGKVASVEATAATDGTVSSVLADLVKEVVLHLEDGSTATITEGFTVLLKEGDALQAGANVLVVIFGDSKELSDANRYNSVEITVTVS